MNTVYLLLDRSQSMSSQWSEALGSVNGYVENLPSDTNVVVATFDTISYDVVRSTTARAFRPLTNEDAMPRGSTPLFDSAARMMWRVLDDKPERAIFVVMTDGEENQSRYFRQGDVKSLASQLEAKKYEVIFLGANFDKVGDTAKGFGVADNKWTNISTRNLNSYMTGTMATSSVDYFAKGVAMNFTADDKARAVSGTGGDHGAGSMSASITGLTRTSKKTL
jgi:hypothetical protein